MRWRRRRGGGQEQEDCEHKKRGTKISKGRRVKGPTWTQASRVRRRPPPSEKADTDAVTSPPAAWASASPSAPPSDKKPWRYSP